MSELQHRPQSSGPAGLFIVFDGPEGCGKSTQTRRLVDRLGALGKAAILVRDPGTTRIGEQIRQILLSPENAEMAMRCEMLLYMAARAQMMTEMILPALEAGKVVICDRFVSSTLAYQLGGEGLSAADISAVADIAIKSRWPDLTIILDMPAADSFKRVQREKDRIEQRPLEYHEQVRQNYLSQAQLWPDRYKVINAARSIEEVEKDIWSLISCLKETWNVKHET